MAFDKAKEYLEKYGYGEYIMTFDRSTATVAEAAMAVGCCPGMIAKTLSFMQKEGPLVIVAAGDCKIDNKKYKAEFSEKAHMLSFEMAKELIGHEVGGVCPFGTNPGVRVYLDRSLLAYKTVYPAVGSANSAVALSPEMLENCLPGCKWVDVTCPM